MNKGYSFLLLSPCIFKVRHIQDLDTFRKVLKPDHIYLDLYIHVYNEYIDIDTFLIL